MAIFTNAGKALTTARMKGLSAEPSWVAIGTGTTAEAATQTALVTEVESRVNGTSSQVTTTVTDDTYQVIGTITATVARAVTEAGLFTASTAGTMPVRGLFSVVNLAINDSIQLTIKLAYS